MPVPTSTRHAPSSTPTSVRRGAIGRRNDREDGIAGPRRGVGPRPRPPALVAVAALPLLLVVVLVTHRGMGGAFAFAAASSPSSPGRGRHNRVLLLRPPSSTTAQHHGDGDQSWYRGRGIVGPGGGSLPVRPGPRPRRAAAAVTGFAFAATRSVPRGGGVGGGRGTGATTATTALRAGRSSTSEGDDDPPSTSTSSLTEAVAVGGEAGTTGDGHGGDKNNLTVARVAVVASASGDDGDDHDDFDYPHESIDSILSHLFSLEPPSASIHASRGLTEAQASERLSKFGYNRLVEPPGKSLLALIAEQFDDRLVQILLVVALMSGAFSYFEVTKSGGSEESLLKSFVEPLIISTILVLNAAVGVWQSKSAEGSLEALKKMQPSLATVLRDGAWVDGIDASLLVPGDVVRLRVGDAVPADARVLAMQTSSLGVDEGSLTGESDAVQKLPGDEGSAAERGGPVQGQVGMVFSGTMVTSGVGTALVVRTGMSTEFGKIQEGVVRAQQTATKTPLTVKLDEFGSTLTVLIAIICLTVFVASIPKFTDPSFASVWAGAIYYAKVSVALGVAAIPEGLPAVITLCLSLGTRRMAQRNVIVRKLPSVETLGSCNVICTDKTGTLTMNEMTATSLVTLEGAGGTAAVASAKSSSRGGKKKGGEEVHVREHSISGLSYSPLGGVDGIDSEEYRNSREGSIHDVMAVSSLCNDAKIVGQDGDDGLESSDAVVVAEAESATSKASSKKRDPATHKRQKGISSGATTLKFERVGEPTEAALCTLVEKLARPREDDMALESINQNVTLKASDVASHHVDRWREDFPRVATLEFSRDRKSMSVLARTEGGRNRLLVKGAPNLLLERCTRVKLRDGEVVQLTPSLRRSIEAKTTELASRPLRCLALATREYDDLPSSLRKTHDAKTAKRPSTDGMVTNEYAINPRDHPLLKDPSNYRKIESNLTLVGIVGMMDPARPEVADSIIECKNAGIRVIMITGDAKDTAVAIARDVNIFPPLSATAAGAEDATGLPATRAEAGAAKEVAFEGREFFALPYESQLSVLSQPSNILFCRAEPSDKQRLISLLQKLDYVPAMTGDGVNDAPALQQAAIGIAMGITGTEVSKSASDMIITDDNFATIVDAIEEGRCIYANMQSFINFLISCNIGEVFCILLSTVMGVPEPLTAMHLLWVNLVTDGPPATALGFNPPSDDLMLRKPRPTDEPIMTRWLLTRYTITGLYVGLATVGIFVSYYLNEGVTLSQLSSWSKCGTLWQPTSLLTPKTCEELFQGQGRQLPQTLSLTALVCMEMIKALGGVSVDNSIFKFGPQKNPWLVLGVTVPSLLHLAVVYSDRLGVPALGESFGMVPLSGADWLQVLLWSAPILLVDEVLKAIGRKLASDKAKELEQDVG